MPNKLSIGLLFGCVIAVFACLIHFISQSVVSKGVSEIELREAESNAHVLYSILDVEKIRFRQHVFACAVLDTSYDYIENRDRTKIDTQFSDIRISSMHCTGAAYYDSTGKRLAFIDGSRQEYGREWTEAEAAVFDRVVQHVHENGLESADGYVSVNGMGMVVAVHTVYDSLKKKPSNGYLVMAGVLEGRFREEAQKLSGLPFSILPLNVYDMVEGVALRDTVRFLGTENDIHVYCQVSDIFGKPAFCLELEEPRTIAVFGREMSRKNFVLTLILCILVLFAGIVLLHLSQKSIIRREMDYRVKHDSLTGLPNTALFQERLADILKDAREDGTGLGVLYIDVDNFKSLNDCYGYQEGDGILREMAARLRRMVPTGCVARSGADNFLVAVTDSTHDRVVEQARGIQAELDRPFMVSSSSMHIGTSIGLGFSNETNEDSAVLVHEAELAMFDAKEKGGNVISLFREEMRTMAAERKHLEIALREAIKTDAFTVYYQPKVDTEKHDVVGCEALVRWQGADGRWVPPPRFIPVAEELGLVTHIDMFVLRSACRQVLTWREDGSGAVPISVNMSVRSILSDGFADMVLRILEEEGTPASLIDIEITESSFMSDMNKALTAISRLHNAGLHVELDDFGTGYSSLQYLSSMPISILKIDKKFVDDIFSGKEASQPLVKSIISLAAGLGMRTVSEGVEDKKQLAFLVGNGAHIIQGYLFSKPLNATECGEFLRNRQARIAAVMQG